MPRPLRFVIPGAPHHVTQRGNYRQRTFFQDSDYQRYILLLREYSQQADVTIQAYCLMPNHVHLVLTPAHQDALARLLQRLHADFARIQHIHQERAGHLWQGRYFSTPMDDAHFWQAMVYVEQNPQRAELVKRCWEWPWSSAVTHLRGTSDGLVDLTEWRLKHTSETWKQCLELGIRDAALLERIREATGKGWPLGSETFLERLAQSLGRPTRPGIPGPKVRTEFGS